MLNKDVQIFKSERFSVLYSSIRRTACSRTPYMLPHFSGHRPMTPLLLLLRPQLRRLLPITPDHDHGEEASHNRNPQQHQDDWYSYGPDSGREE